MDNIEKSIAGNILSCSFRQVVRFLSFNVIIHSFFQVIVTPLKSGQDPGNSADRKYEFIPRTYEDQAEGEPYITAGFAKGEARSTFTVGDGKYYYYQRSPTPNATGSCK